MIDITQNGTSIASWVVPDSLVVTQNLTNEADTAQFSIQLVSSRTAPVFDDNIVIYDGATKIFAGKVVEVSESLKGSKIPIAKVQCVDHRFEFDRLLAAKTYENQTIGDIIANLVSLYAPTFTTNNVNFSFVIQKIVFNQIPLSQCIRKLADIVRFDWYIDEYKDVHFFEKFTNIAPYDITDTAGNYVYNSLVRTQDGSQLVNRVKVRGGEYDGSAYTDIITASGTPMSFLLPYKMSNLIIELDTGAGYVNQPVGIDFIDAFGTPTGTPVQVLYNFQMQSFRFGTPVASGAKIRFSGNPKVPVLAIAEDGASVATYGAIEKLIRENSIASNEIARKRAAAELIAFSELVTDATFSTYTAGLKTGMLLRVSSTNRNFDDDLIIKRITFKYRTATTYDYKVDCISTQRYTMLDILRKFVTPEEEPIDANETSEQVYALNEIVTSADLWTNIAPELITETVASVDDWFNVAGTIKWVYGFYFPISDSDTNRMGRYDKSAKYQ